MTTMINEQDLEEAISEFTNARQSFTSMDVRDRLRDNFGLSVRYRETNYATLTFMQQNGIDVNYVAQSVEVDRNDGLGSAFVWQFTPMEELTSKGDKAQKKSKVGGLFARLFR